MKITKILLLISLGLSTIYANGNYECDENGKCKPKKERKYKTNSGKGWKIGNPIKKKHKKSFFDRLFGK